MHAIRGAGAGESSRRHSIVRAVIVGDTPYAPLRGEVLTRQRLELEAGVDGECARGLRK